jgi:uncharacterized cupredoxin-like copper-binding protein
VGGLPLAGPIAAASHAGNAVEYARAAHPLAAPVNFTVNMTDTPAFAPSTLSGAASGEAVSVKLDNVGLFPHSFTVSRIPNYEIPAGFTPAELDAWFAANGSLANVSVAPGATGWANFTLPSNSSGLSFEFVSVVAYQFQAGMSGKLEVAAGAPSELLSVSALSSLAFSPNVLVANASGYPVTIEVEVTNVGTLSHTWTLSALPNVFPTPTNFSAFFQQHPPLANLAVPAVDGGVVNATFTIPAPGVYAFLCEIPGHFANGMNGTLWVGLLPPAPAAPLSTAVVQTGILAGAGALLLIGVVLTLGATFSGRFPRAPRGGSAP